MLTTVFKKAKQAVALVPMVALVFGFVATPAALAAPADGLGDNPLSSGTDSAKGRGQNDSLTNVFQIVTNILLFLVGAVAVIMLVIGGLRYVTSNGDQNAVTGAKNTIMYAIIGIVVAFLAYAAVNFVVAQLTNSNNATTSYVRDYTA